MREVVLPDDAAIESKVTEVFSNLGVELIEIPFSFESARASFLKTVDKVPPSETTQEFKDGVLWADCIALLKSDDVYLISNDTHFYEGRKYPNGLARNLRDEASGASHSIRLFPKLADLLEEIKTDVSINEDRLASLFLEAYGESINNILGRNQFELGPRISVHKVLYATEQPDQLSIEFTLEYECLDTSNENRANGRLTLRGDGMYDAATEKFNGLRNYGESLSWLLSDGRKSKHEISLDSWGPAYSVTERLITLFATNSKVIRCQLIFSGKNDAKVIRCQLIFSGKNDELTPDFLEE